MKKRNSYNILSTLILALAAVTVLFPLIWVAFTSLKSSQEFYFNIWGLPKEFVWDNYVEAWVKTNFGKNFMNSLLVTFGALLINLVCSTTTAYCIGRYQYRGRRITNGIYMASMMIPSIIGLIPQYFLLANMKLLDTRLGLTLVYGFSAIPFSVFTLLGFFQALPHELEEAAMIDGCTPSQAMRNVTIPLMRSSFVTCLFLSITRCFMVYDVNLSLTKGEPFNSSVMAAMHVYNKAFVYKDYGTGQAEALILFIVCAIIGITQVYVGKKGEVSA